MVSEMQNRILESNRGYSRVHKEKVNGLCLQPKVAVRGELHEVCGRARYVLFVYRVLWLQRGRDECLSSWARKYGYPAARQLLDLDSGCRVVIRGCREQGRRARVDVRIRVTSQLSSRRQSIGFVSQIMELRGLHQ